MSFSFGLLYTKLLLCLSHKQTVFLFLVSFKSKNKNNGLNADKNYVFSCWDQKNIQCDSEHMFQQNKKIIVIPFLGVCKTKTKQKKYKK